MTLPHCWGSETSGAALKPLRALAGVGAAGSIAFSADRSSLARPAYLKVVVGAERGQR